MKPKVKYSATKKIKQEVKQQQESETPESRKERNVQQDSEKKLCQGRESETESKSVSNISSLTRRPGRSCAGF